MDPKQRNLLSMAVVLVLTALAWVAVLAAG
jgi:hypothetical protein